eukprot:134262_1
MATGRLQSIVKKYMLLVTGYVSTIDSSLSQQIPKEINRLCFLFYFNQNEMHQIVIISDNLMRLYLCNQQYLEKLSKKCNYTLFPCLSTANHIISKNCLNDAINEFLLHIQQFQMHCSVIFFLSKEILNATAVPYQYQRRKSFGVKVCCNDPIYAQSILKENQVIYARKQAGLLTDIIENKIFKSLLNEQFDEFIRKIKPLSLWKWKYFTLQTAMRKLKRMTYEIKHIRDDILFY